MKVAIVHDWLVSYRGGEKVLEAILNEFPDAPVYTLFYDADAMPESITSKVVRYPGYLQRFKKIRKFLLPALPACIESLNLCEYDLIISTSSCVAKGVIPGPGAKHLCYIHSPMRYLWDQKEEYLKPLRGVPLAPFLFSLLSSRLRLWDQVSASRVDRFVANSSFVRQRVLKYYGSECEVIHPPVDTEFFSPPGSSDTGTDRYFLAAGALVAYKGFELAVHACERAGQRLIVAGGGPSLKSLKKIAGRYTEFYESPDARTWRRLLRGAEALLFPGIEDFGMTAIEAMACGTPVLALKAGGALDFIEEGISGEFVFDRDINSWVEAIGNFERSQYDPAKIRAVSLGFSKSLFQARFRAAIDQLLNKNG